MVTSAVIGSTGFIGQFLKKKKKNSLAYNSKNIDQVTQQSFDTVYCCAPTGNRLFANQNHNEDRDNVIRLISSLDSMNIKKLVLVSTVDTQQNPDTAYGANRLLLENYVKTCSNYRIIRLCTLVHPTIKKNVLYDLKNQKFLQSINLDQVLQWCKLADLPKYLTKMDEENLTEFNLVSEPILTNDIVNTFFNHLGIDTHKPAKPYNITNGNNSYVYSKQQTMEFIKDYVNN